MAAGVYLRDMVAADVTDAYLGWFRDPAVTRFLEARNISRQDALDYLEAGRRTRGYFQYAVCLSETDRHVGSVKIGPVKWTHGTSDLVTVIGDRSVWGGGVASQAIRQAIGIAFDRHGLRKLSASIDSLNEASVRAYVRAGFSVEARLPGQFMHPGPGGECILSDKIYVGVFNKNYAPPSL